MLPLDFIDANLYPRPSFGGVANLGEFGNRNFRILRGYQCATGSKILTEPDQIGIILAGTGLITSQKKLTGFDRIFKTLTLNLQVTNINMHGSLNFEI